MASTTTTNGSGEQHTTVGRILEILTHVEWECHYVRLALQRLPADTKIVATQEMIDRLGEKPPMPSGMIPPC